MNALRLALVLAGAAATAAIGFGSLFAHGPEFVAELERTAAAARDAAGGRGIAISFRSAQGSLTRHAVLSGGGGLDEATRARAASAIAAVPGVGGASWRGGGVSQRAYIERGVTPGSQHCQKDVEGILESRSIRFSEASAAIDPESVRLLNEVADALRPCVGSIIAITGHTDSKGDPVANLALSRARAASVRWALVGRGIPADGLRATGKGSSDPLPGLAPTDPANRRIEFSLIETVPLQPTPVDTPGPG